MKVGLLIPWHVERSHREVGPAAWGTLAVPESGTFTRREGLP